MWCLVQESDPGLIDKRLALSRLSKDLQDFEKEGLSDAFFKSTIFYCHVKFNSCLIYLHFVYDLQKYLCLQVNGLRELGSIKLIQTQGKAILLLILFQWFLAKELLKVAWVGWFLD